jgi:hypothetical protein
LSDEVSIPGKLEVHPFAVGVEPDAVNGVVAVALDMAH